MITSPKPSITVLNQIIQVHDEIDGVILRFDAAEKDIIHFINQLITRIPKDKIIVHNNPNILFACHLTRIHFKESNSEIDAFRNNHPEIQVSQSVHWHQPNTLNRSIYHLFYLVMSSLHRPNLIYHPEQQLKLMQSLILISL